MPINMAESAQDTASDISNTVRETARRASDTASEFADSASEFLQSDRVKEIGNQAKKYIKANPMVAILGAVVVGIVVGRMSARD